eukprot:12931084-Prorocentrum_lima.AAC.1
MRGIRRREREGIQGKCGGRAPPTTPYGTFKSRRGCSRRAADATLNSRRGTLGALRRPRHHPGLSPRRGTTMGE